MGKIKYFNKSDLEAEFRNMCLTEYKRQENERDFKLLAKLWRNLLQKYVTKHLAHNEVLNWEIPSWAKEKK